MYEIFIKKHKPECLFDSQMSLAFPQIEASARRLCQAASLFLALSRHVIYWVGPRVAFPWRLGCQSRRR